ncbi:MAG: ATP-binding protein [Acidovorax sp.]|nr:MAG: ATP-binding protein [Acidovorax sp.]
MFRTRPPWFAVVCVSIWMLQLGLIVVAFHWVKPLAGIPQGWRQGAVLAATLALGSMLLVQLPRALQWRPRRTARVSPEVAAERRRIARDLHDNLGAQLVCALVLLDPERPREREIHAALQKCLLDMRLVVDSIDGGNAPFADRLAQLRYRIEPVLSRRGIRMEWEVEPPHCAVFPNADSAIHLVAIAQEALSNALQYADATVIRVSTQFIEDAQTWCMEVCDNGRGIQTPKCPDTLAAAGRGLTGMTQRARLAGGELFVLQGEGGGTCIRAVVPCITSV